MLSCTDVEGLFQQTGQSAVPRGLLSDRPIPDFPGAARRQPAESPKVCHCWLVQQCNALRFVTGNPGQFGNQAFVRIDDRY